MRFEFDYNINGRKVTKNEWLSHIASEAVDAAGEEVEAKIAKMRCPTHGMAPKVTSKKLGGDVKLSIEACCEPMRAKAVEVARGKG